MQLNEIRLGKKIFVSLKQIDDLSEPSNELPSQIVDIINEKEFVISAPFYKTYSIKLEANSQLILMFTHESGIYEFEAIVIDELLEENLKFFMLKINSEIKRIQRRQHFRVKISAPIVYQYITNGQEVYGQGMTKDISGGGLKFTCSDKLQTGILIDIFVKLIQNFEIKTIARVIRCSFIEPGKNEICIIFEDLSFGRREHLIKHIFDIQRNGLKNR